MSTFSSRSRLLFFRSIRVPKNFQIPIKGRRHWHASTIIFASVRFRPKLSMAPWVISREGTKFPLRIFIQRFDRENVICFLRHNRERRSPYFFFFLFFLFFFFSFLFKNFSFLQLPSHKSLMFSEVFYGKIRRSETFKNSSNIFTLYSFFFFFFNFYKSTIQ